MQENIPDLKLDWASYKSAKYACENWHYSKCMPTSKTAKIGVWEDGKFVGVIIYSYGANPNLYKKYVNSQAECVELTRIALGKHANPVSKMISISLKMVKKTYPKIRIIISFADLDQDHAGAIYQASNFIYVGNTTKDVNIAYIIKGKIVHGKSVSERLYKYGASKNLKNVKTYLDKNATYHKTKGKHKYIYCFDKKLKKEVLKESIPYPKKACPIGVDGNTSAIHAEVGGSNPTMGLNIQKQIKVV